MIDIDLRTYSTEEVVESVRKHLMQSLPASDHSWETWCVDDVSFAGSPVRTWIVGVRCRICRAQAKASMVVDKGWDGVEQSKNLVGMTRKFVREVSEMDACREFRKMNEVRTVMES